MVVNSKVRESAARSSYILGKQGRFPPIGPQNMAERRTERSFQPLVDVVASIARAPSERDFVECVTRGLPDVAATLRLLLSERAHAGPSVDLRSARIQALTRIEVNWGVGLRHDLQHDIDVRFAAIRLAESLNSNACPSEHEAAERRDAEQFATSALIAALMAEVIDISVEVDDADVDAVKRASEWHREMATAMYVSAMTAYERWYGIVDEDLAAPSGVQRNTRSVWPSR